MAKALGTSVAASHEIADENRGVAGIGRRAAHLASGVPSRLDAAEGVPLGLVTRLEEIATDKIELSNGRYMVQYREQLMPLVQMAGVNVATSGAQPILVFADDGRSMGLVVDEIIDIVEERLHIEVAGSQDGILGSAVIKGPRHRSDRCRPLPADGVCRLVLAQGDASLGSVAIRAAGRRQRILPQHAGAGAESRRLQGSRGAQRAGGPRRAAFGSIVRRGADRHRDARYERLRIRRDIRADQHFTGMPIIALSSVVSPAAIERGRLAGFHDYVAKFDRPGLIAALKEQTAELSRAA